MRAAVFRKVNTPFEIEEVTLDKPRGREVLIRTKASGICHSDYHFYKGLYPYPAPTILGHEAAGVVEAVGEGVSYVKPGDHVITCISAFCGHCEFCLEGRMSLCQEPELQRGEGEPPRISQNGEPIFQFLNLSAYAEQMLVHEHALAKVNPDMPFDKAALIGCGVITGTGAIFRTANVAPGETVAVIGCGGIGLSAVNGAAIAGAGRVIAVDRVASKLELATKMGATDVVNASETNDPVGVVRDLTGGGVHHAIEAIGLKDTAEQAFRMLKRGGTATIIGMIPVGTMIELHGVEFLQEKKIQGSLMGSNQFRTDMPRLIDFYLADKLKLDLMVSEHIALEDLNDGLAALESGETARSVIVFD